MLGTPCYSAPEQLFGERVIDHRADIWALGVVLYECLSNQLPVYGENLGQILKMLTSGEIVPLERLLPDLPADIVGLVGRMLSRPLDKRPKDMREVLEVLQRYSNLSVRSFGDAKSQPPLIDSHPSGASHKAPPNPLENPTIVASAPKTTPEAGLDTASPHAVSQPSSPRSRRFVMMVGVAFVLGLVGLLGWQLGHSHDRPEPFTAASQATTTAAAPLPSPTSEPAPRPETEVPSTAVPAPTASAVVADTHKAGVVRPGAPPPKPMSKPDAAAHAAENDPAKAASQKRPGGLIEDVPF
jgi:serine/threonine-protein kinase